MSRPRGGDRAARVPDRILWVNGRLRRGEEAALSLFDRGARDGEGLFETIRVRGRRPELWQEHVERLVVSAAELGFPVPPTHERLAAAIDELLAASDLEDAAVRITVTRGIPGGRPTRAGCWIEAEPLAARRWRSEAGAHAIVSRTPFQPGPLGRHKTTSRLPWSLAREEARAARADEAILVDAEGVVLEGTVTNVFAARNGAVVTPPLALGILPGIARARTIALCHEAGIPVREDAIQVEALRAADEIFLTNSIQTVVPLATLDGEPLRSRDVGQRLRGRWGS